MNLFQLCQLHLFEHNTLINYANNKTYIYNYANSIHANSNYVNNNYIYTIMPISIMPITFI